MRTILRAVALGSAAGLAIGAGGSPTELCALAFLGPALLLLAIELPEPRAAEIAVVPAAVDAAPSPTVSLRTALAAGAACGFATNALCTSWIVTLLEVYGGFPRIASLPVGALMWIGQSLPWASAAWLAVPLIRAGVPGWVALPMTITIGGSYAPMLFPWRLGVSQMPDVLFVQCAELGGPALVDLCLALASCGMMHALRGRDRRAAIAGALALVIPFGYGALRVEQVRALRESSPALAVGVVQPNIGILEKHEPRLREAHLELHRAMTIELERAGAELVLWPESSYPFPVERADPGDSQEHHRKILRGGVRGPIAFGALTRSGEAHYNSVVALGADGRYTGVYDKVHLLAFGEYVPLWDYLPPIQEMFHRGFTAGARASLLPIAGTTIGPLDCYEDLLAEHARATAALDPGFLANFTNDAWFGDTDAPHLHHMLARMRAVETRRDLVRAVNTGISGLVLATGQDMHRTLPFSRTSFVAEVRLLEGTVTPWTRYGDQLTPALLGALVGIALARRRRADRVEQSATRS
jgi:apolipoprotein N-acyltransferase